MKKLLSFLVAGIAALGLASCSGDLHNEIDPSSTLVKTLFDTSIDIGSFATFELAGAMQGWDDSNGIAFEKNDDGLWEADFVAPDADECGFCYLTEVNATKGSWNGQIGGDKIEADSLPDGVKYEKKDNGYGGWNAVLTGLTAGKTYKMTVDASTGVYVFSIEITAAAKPTPFYLDGEFVTGCDDLLVGGEKCQSNFPSSQLLFNPELDKKTSELTYTFDVTFTSKNHNWHEPGEAAIKISQPGWKNSYGKTTIKVGEDFVELESSGDNAPVSGLKDGKAYRIVIKTTPEKKVYAKVYEILAYTLQLKITGFDGVDGQTALVHGTFDGWPGWTSAWGGTAKVSTAPHAVIAGNTAVINITSGVAAPNEEISFESCGYYGVEADDNIAKATGVIKIGGANFNITGKITKAGNYVATLDLSEGEISEAVSE